MLTTPPLMTLLTHFKKKKLNKTKRVCLCLKEARAAAEVSLDELARRTRISKKYLQALEECRFADIPYAPIYQKNFVRQYIEALALPTNTLLQQFIIEETPPPIKPQPHPRPAIGQKRLQNWPALLRLTSAALVIITLIGYLGLQVKSILEPPDLALHVPQNGYVTDIPRLIVQGQTDNEARVFINGQTIATNNRGQFKEVLDLSPGINTVVVSAKKRHGKTMAITRHVILKETQRFSLNH